MNTNENSVTLHLAHEKSVRYFSKCIDIHIKFENLRYSIYMNNVLGDPTATYEDAVVVLWRCGRL